MSGVILHAPLAGWAAPLDEVPDAVFAEPMMGEGLAIDPIEGLLSAPCDAEVISVPDSRHAVTLRLANGAELLIHIGIDTVGLGGEGFTAHVAAGQKVKTGDPLLGFDLDAVALGAKSLISPIVLASEGFAWAALALDRAVAPGDPLAEVRRADTAPIAEAVAEATATAEITIRGVHGIHARPAARIASMAKGYAAAIELRAKGKTANARSPVALMALGLEQGEPALLAARGADATAAVSALVSLIETGLGEEQDAAPAAIAPPVSSEDGLLHGVCASPGLAIGPAAHFALPDPEVREDGQGVVPERRALAAARGRVSARLAAYADPNGLALAHQGLLDDPELLAAAEADIAAGRSAGFAWRAAIEATAAAIRATGNSLLIERIDDLVDIERQVLVELAGNAGVGPRNLPDGAIVVAETLLPSQLMALDLERVGGFCTAGGGPTAHVAIVAASAGVPMLAAVGEGVRAIAEGATMILDASAGWIDPAPDAAALEAARGRLEDRRRTRAAELAAAAEECRMADGTRIEIFANLASVDDAARAVAAGAEGCGLLRTEFLFHDRAEPPSEDEQAGVYAAIARALGGKPLIIRTLDAGGDKPLAYLALPPEDNPALGLRGVRLSLARPALLATQLRAILRASPEGDLRIMVPMVVDVDELKAVQAVLAAAAADLGIPPVPVGVNVETPAAALLAGRIAAEADFLSIGTNDLSQYSLAADRGNPATAARIDALHPAVLRLIAATGEGALGQGKWLGICGGLASDPLAAPLLIGLGATELSATPAAIPALKAKVRGLDMAECRALAARALEAGSAGEVRALLQEGAR